MYHPTERERFWHGVLALSMMIGIVGCIVALAVIVACS